MVPFTNVGDRVTAPSLYTQLERAIARNHRVEAAGFTVFTPPQCVVSGGLTRVKSRPEYLCTQPRTISGTVQ
jgi:hypothetical protein